MTNDE